MAELSKLAAPWASMYANHALLRTLVAFAHVGALVVGGGAAVTLDRTTLSVTDARRAEVVAALGASHRVVIGSLVLVMLSGVLMFAADVDALIASRVFWIKMAIVAGLIVNGALLHAAERRAAAGDPLAWRRLHSTAMTSVFAWLAATLAGVALLNIG